MWQCYDREETDAIKNISQAMGKSEMSSRIQLTEYKQKEYSGERQEDIQRLCGERCGMPDCCQFCAEQNRIRIHVIGGQQKYALYGNRTVCVTVVLPQPNGTYNMHESQL